MSTAATRTADVYQRVRDHVPEVEWATFADDVEAILRLKQEKDAVVMAHNYQTPEIVYAVADVVGDSLALARDAQHVDQGTIVLSGVHFMAETAKILNPDKRVLVPDPLAGCSLASSITADDVRGLKAQHPGVPVVTYVNTTAAVKAESDITCTSGNAVRVLESLGADRVIMIPDQYLARNIAAQTGVEVITWLGSCEVHERFTPLEIDLLRVEHPGVVVLAHPECPPEVVAAADHSGSTAQMSQFVSERRPRTIALITECSMSDNLAIAHPDVSFVRPCNLCPHMKRNSLAKIRASLEHGITEVTVDPSVAGRAREAVERMLSL